MNFENKSYNGIYYSRIIASWVNVGGNPRKNPDGFKKWLRSLKVPEDVATDIYTLATNGKMELEISARRFMTGNK